MCVKIRERRTRLSLVRSKRCAQRDLTDHLRDFAFIHAKHTNKAILEGNVESPMINRKRRLRVFKEDGITVAKSLSLLPPSEKLGEEDAAENVENSSDARGKEFRCLPEIEALARARQKGIRTRDSGNPWNPSLGSFARADSTQRHTCARCIRRVVRKMYDSFPASGKPPFLLEL